ncbi:hypothetical protein BD560DRAFT_406807 [Blakeslea trispora]|nr:hypothetical protein BD560DRAFT_406807 [Blakeslea trispora]
MSSLPSSSFVSKEITYGSLGNTHRSNTPTTISSDQHDEGLYLTWTQELLREQGFSPSSCRQIDQNSLSSSSEDSELDYDTLNRQLLLPPSIASSDKISKAKDSHFLTCLFSCCF